MPNQTNFCFTLNNYTDEDVNAITACSGVKIRYIFAGKEVAPTTLTPHLQGFIVFSVRLSVKGAGDILEEMFSGRRPHVEASKGTVQHNIDYCGKSGATIEFGTAPIRGDAASRKNKTDYGRGLALALKRDYATLQSEDPGLYIRHFKTLKQIGAESISVKSEATLEGPCGVLYSGDTGTGKTETAMKFNPYIKLKSNHWWDGYEGEDTVLIDDVGLDWMAKNWEIVLNLCDKYPFRCEVKGGMLLIRPKRIILTSNNTLGELISVCPFKQQDAVRRRFVEDKTFTKCDLHSVPGTPLDDDLMPLPDGLSSINWSFLDDE